MQAVGLTAVAALIGAGGLGAIIFQGLAASALDLVLLGVVPLVALAVVADACLLKLAISMRDSVRRMIEFEHVGKSYGGSARSTICR